MVHYKASFQTCSTLKLFCYFCQSFILLKYAITLNAPITTAADDISIFFSKKISLTFHMNRILFSLKIKENRMSSASIFAWLLTVTFLNSSIFLLSILYSEGLLKEVGAGYTFFWSGRKKEERREAGVGFAIKSHLVSKLSGLSKGINDRLMTLRFPLSGKRHATIVSAYASTMTNPDEVKDVDLDSVISAAPRTDKLILLEDFNTRVSTDHQTWEGVIRSEGVGKCNSNGLLILRKCAEHELLIINTVFRLPTRRKTTWMHPRSKHWHLIDYVIVRRKARQDVRVTNTMYGADCWTDHRLVSKLNLRIQPVRRL